MKKTISPIVLIPAAICFLALVASCKKSSNSSSSISVQNLAGTYTITALTATVAPFPPQNIIDSLKTCQRDDEYVLKTDLTYQYVDAGTKCVPPGDHTGTWALSGTTLTIDSTVNTIQKFDGHVLVLTTNVTFNGISGITTETFTKQ